MQNTILVTGGAGFIGSNFILQWMEYETAKVVNLDKLTYAGNLRNLEGIQRSPKYEFVHGDICDSMLVRNLMHNHRPKAVLNFAAETHVDRSIFGPEEFMRTNVQGTFCLLEAARSYWDELRGAEREDFRFLHVSTDEVYGSLGSSDPSFTESSPYSPNSPYSASKAASDHLVRAYAHTYGLLTLTTNCSNNYGPYQFPEKLIPLILLNALEGKPLPVYGDGLNVRDWLYVGDHCQAIRAVLANGRPGEAYNVGGWSERKNIDVVKTVCAILDELQPGSAYHPHEQLIAYVTDRPGHDRRYAMNAHKIQSELGWRPSETFESGLRNTVNWYLENMDWVREVTSGNYRNWIVQNYSGREAQCGA